MPLPTILSGNVASALPTGYDVANSCCFQEAVMHKTPGSEGDTQKMTLSMWVKRSELGVEQQMWHTQNGSNQATTLVFGSNDKLYFIADDSNKLITTRVFRDPSAWMHIVLAIDTTQGTAGNRAKLYINGVQETAFDTESQPSEDQNLQWNKTTSHRIGSQADTANNAFNGYLAEVVWIDGTQYAASDFGEFDEDSPTIWKPKDVSGLTFGTNGFYLDFEDSSNLGNDANGGTDLTEVSIAAADQTTDSPTNSFCTFNPLAPSAAALAAHANGFGEGNRQNGEQSPNNWQSLPSTFGVTSAKWYWEFKDENSWGSTSNSTRRYGICDLDTIVHTESSSTDVKFSDTTSAYAYMNASGVRYNNGTISGTTSDHPTFTDDDIIMVALDCDNNKLYFGKNGTWNDSGDPTSGSTGTGSVADISATATWSPYVETQYGSDNVSANFGNPIAAPSSGNADGNGYGNFEYAPPSGYLALCTKNLGSDGG
jgi:hypothetical protein